MLLLILREFVKEVLQIYRRRFSIWDVVGLSAAVLFITLMSYPLWIIGYIFFVSIILHSFLDEFHRNGDDFPYLEMATKMKIWRIIFDVWNLTCAIWMNGFSSKMVGNILNSLLTDIYLLMLVTNDWGEE